jgi:hypothetical protein
MVNDLKDVIVEFPELIVGKAANLAGERLFDIREETEVRSLEEERAIVFHTVVIYGNESTKDTQTVVAFLTTRVKSPDKDDWGKLKRVLKYLNGTKYLKLTIRIENLRILK